MKKYVSLLMAGALAVSMLGGCGGGWRDSGPGGNRSGRGELGSAGEQRRRGSRGRKCDPYPGA